MHTHAVCRVPSAPVPQRHAKGWCQDGAELEATVLFAAWWPTFVGSARGSAVGRAADSHQARTLHRNEVEWEHIHRLLVAVAHARVEKAFAVLLAAVVAHARVIVRAAHVLAPRDLDVDTKIP